jgi:hypothetical protein
MGSHPVAAVQYTFTHKQHTERHKTNNTQNNTKIFGRVRAVPHLCGVYPGICLTTEEKARKTSKRGKTSRMMIGDGATVEWEESRGAQMSLQYFST